MPYPPEHKINIRKQIVDYARILFNRKGFSQVSIDEIMAGIGLTRGDFYNHFSKKEELYAESIACFLDGPGKRHHERAGIDPQKGETETVLAMIDAYLSDDHASDLDNQCPMIALPSDVARATVETRKSYEALLRAMIWLYEHNLPKDEDNRKSKAQMLAALSVGGMVLSRTIIDNRLAQDIRKAAREFALSSVKQQ